MRNDERRWTPGPWVACAGDDCPRLVRDGKRTYFPHVHIGPDDHGWTYRSGDGRDYVGTPAYLVVNDVSNRLPAGHGTMREHDANARLIAAAPEMYEALRGVWDPEHDLLFAPDRDDEVRQVWVTNGTLRRIATATAKADGKVTP